MAEEVVILEHMGAFERHGFAFAVDHDAPPSHRLALKAVPFSKATQCGTEGATARRNRPASTAPAALTRACYNRLFPPLSTDVLELASMIRERPTAAATIRLPKVLAMWASRACRSAVMIGTALDHGQLTRVSQQRMWPGHRVQRAHPTSFHRNSPSSPRS